jgi:DNA-binding beta-propeller fold protein YncE
MTLLSSLRRLLALPSRRPAKRRRPSCRPWLEVLEDRLVPSASISVAGATVNEIGSPSAFITTGSGGLSQPFGVTTGPDGNVYVAENGGAVLRYNGATGAFINTFVAQGSGGLSGVYGLAFGPDSNLYVASQSTNQVLEYNGATGAFIKAFIPAGSGGLDAPYGVTFGSDGSLYVSSNNTNAILRYQGPLAGSPGAPLPASGRSGATFVTPSSGGLFQPLNSVFGPDGNLYVDGGQNLSILRYNGTTGAFIDTFVPGGRGDLAAGRGMVFDQDGRLYVTDSGNGVHRYDAQGNFLGDFLVNAVSPELSKPQGMAFDAQGNLLITCRDYNTVVRYDRGVVVSLSAASATPVSMDYATADGSALAGSDYYAQSGTVTFAPGQTSRRILLATQEEPVLDGNESFSVQLSNATGGATITTGSAAVTIVDPTRQFSVADASAVEGDHTAHYRGAFVQGIPGEGINMVTFGPDGNLYANGSTGPGSQGIKRYNGTTGAFIDQFVADGSLHGSSSPVFRAGYLYLAAGITNEVLRYDATTGAFVDAFVTAGSGGLSSPQTLAFGTDGNLYVSAANGVLRYDGATGAPLGTFIASGSGVLNSPSGMAFDPMGSYLYVASTSSNQVLKYNAQTGAFVAVAASAGVSAPKDVLFGSDGLLYVLSTGNNRILRFTANGAYVDDYVPAGSGGMTRARHMAFGPDGDVYVATDGPTGPDQIMRFGTENEALFTVTNTTPSTLALTVNYATTDGTAVAGRDYTAASGTLTFAPGATTETIRVPILDDSAVESGLSFTLTLSNPEAATLSRGQATGAVIDSDAAAKFYVVNDATTSLGGTNTTYKYQPFGSQQAPYGLSLNDLDPRGVATTAAGTTNWVVDANKNVYVYSSGGALLGSWSAGGLSSSAQLTGIATNGADVWLVDAATAKVYKYAGAAGRRSGSQSAASSFSLVSGKKGNTNPQDIVTDGTSFWVVDGSQLKVFKYTLSGSALGSWAIDPADAHPTGITINPSNVSDIWIVDNGTDRVYQYIGAASRTSGGQNAAATFALVAGDANPQGIADPPPPDTLLTPATASLDVEQPAVTDGLIGGNGRDLMIGGSGAGTFSGFVFKIDPPAGGGLASPLTSVFSSGEPIIDSGASGGGLNAHSHSAILVQSATAAPAAGKGPDVFQTDLSNLLTDGGTFGDWRSDQEAVAAGWSSSDLAFLQEKPR